MSAAKALAMAGNQKFVKFIRDKMSELGMTPVEFAHKIFKAGPNSAYRKILSGRSRPRDVTVHRIAAGLGVEGDILLSLLPREKRVPSKRHEVTSEPPVPVGDIPGLVSMPQPVFSMQVEQDGSVTVGFSMRGLTLDQGMRLMQVIKDERMLQI